MAGQNNFRRNAKKVEDFAGRHVVGWVSVGWEVVLLADSRPNGDFLSAGLLPPVQ
jgi:hypothetical protein